MINTLSIEHAAYLAGFIDGDGSLSMRLVTKHAKVNGGYQTMVYLIQIGQKDRKILDWIQEVVGAGRIIQNHRRGGTFKPGVYHRWSLGGRTQVQALLEQIVPYLVIKKEHALKMLEDTSAPGRTGTRGVYIGR